MKTFIATALLISSFYASAQSMGAGSSSPGSTTTPSSTLGTGASTGVNPATGTSETPASGSVIDRTIAPPTTTPNERQRMEDDLDPTSRDAILREERKKKEDL